MKKLNKIWLLPAVGILILATCTQSNGQISIDSLVPVKDGKLVNNSLSFNFSVTDPGLNFAVPALHSAVSAYYNGLWVFVGGRKNGFHGKGNNPPAFKGTTANDSIWVIDFANKRTWGVPVPANYYFQLTATNAAFCQSATSVYLCGGFTRTDSAAKYSNTTSAYFFELSLPNLIRYVQTGGTTPNFGQVVNKVFQSPYVQVTGGDMLLSNGHFYLVGGQNYDKFYGVGYTGRYTNAIRKFDLVQSGSNWTAGDTVTVTDTVNLHRRDLNLIPYAYKGIEEARIYGGVFTPQDGAYLHPVNITGLAGGQPTIAVDSMTQYTNQYASAKATMVFGADSNMYITAILGGITYEEYNPNTQKLQIGDNGVPMPFSNLISIIIKDRDLPPVEYVQVPPNGDPLLPGYIGANATFIPLPQYTLGSRPDLLDGQKVINALNGQRNVLIGYIYGGIISLGPTSGTNANGHVATYASNTLYQVYMNNKPAVKK